MCQMFSIGKIKDGEFAISLKCDYVIDFGCYDGIIVTAMMCVFSIYFYLDGPFFLTLIPTYTAIWAFAIAGTIHLVLAACRYSQIGPPIIEGVLAMLMVSLSFIATLKTKDLSMHVDPLFAWQCSTRIPQTPAITAPRKPFMLRQFGIIRSVNRSCHSPRQGNGHLWFRNTHDTNISLMRKV